MLHPMVIALICAASASLLICLAVFVKQLILSRDKTINDQAQARALSQEFRLLHEMREEQWSHPRFDEHHDALKDNRSELKAVDEEIKAKLQAKMECVRKLTDAMIAVSKAIESGENADCGKNAYEALKLSVDAELEKCNQEIAVLQERRNSLWTGNDAVQHSLLEEESRRNKHMDEIYTKHTEVLQRVYALHIRNTEHAMQESVEAGTSIFKAIVAPFKALMGYFGLSTGVSLIQGPREHIVRVRVAAAEQEINGLEPLPEEFLEQRSSWMCCV